jgi:hypothetical protein
MVLNITPMKVFVRESSLYNYKPEKNNKWIEGWWHAVKCVSGLPFILEVYFPHCGASYDKLTLYDISTKIPQIEYDLDVLQIWDCFSPNAYIFEKTFFNRCRVETFLKTKKLVEGNYLFTIDWEGYLADVPEEHKSANFIELENGQIAAQPNNRVKFLLPSLLHDDYSKQVIDWEPKQLIESVEAYPKWKLGKSKRWNYSDVE